jgi:hypothetical protein
VDIVLAVAGVALGRGIPQLFPGGVALVALHLLVLRA